MNEFNSDSEYYGNYRDIEDFLLLTGWKKGKPSYENRKISIIFTKDGYSMYILYGCAEDIKDEIL